MIRNNMEYGTLSNNKVWVMREFVNSEANHLGMPLPKGRVRFYRRDTDGQLEFTGEDAIDHTPRDERIRVFTGAAFDIAGERKRTVFAQRHGAAHHRRRASRSRCATTRRSGRKCAWWSTCIAA